GVARLDEPDERIHRVVGGDRRGRLQRADEAHVAGGQADLLLGLAQGGDAQVGLVVVLAPAGERDLAGVAAQVVAPAREDRVQAPVGAVQRHEHGRVDAAVDVQGGRLGGVEQAGGELCGEVAQAVSSAVSTRSLNMTSPSSVRWIGHFAAITRSLATCSSVRWSERRSTRSNRVGVPRSAGWYSQSTSRGPMSHPLRWAYIAIVTAVQEASDAASSSCGLGPASSPPTSGSSSAVIRWWRIR